MSTRTIDDPGQWRVGDMFEGTYHGDAMSGTLRIEAEALKPGVLLVGATIVRKATGEMPTYVTGHVTRTVEPIPEPTELWALVRYADGAVRVIEDKGHQVCEHTAPQKVHGPIVAVSLPHWSDEA